MRISDWSSDVCSSDLVQRMRGVLVGQAFDHHQQQHGAMCDGQRIEGLQRRTRHEGLLRRRRRAGFAAEHRQERTKVVEGTRVYVRVDLGVTRIIKKKKSI